MKRALLAATLAAAALLPVAPVSASCHYTTCLFDGEPICAFHPVCDDLAAILERVGETVDTPEGARASAGSTHTICDTIEDAAPWLVYCHD